MTLAQLGSTTAIEEPLLPAVPNYPTDSPHEKEIEAARQLFLRLLESVESEWVSMGEKNSVRLWKMIDPEDPHGVPFLKGETTVEGADAEAFLSGVVQIPGFRKLWDRRTEKGFMIERYSRSSVLFYALTKGKKYIASPRDIVGIQRNYGEDAGGDRMIVQTSVDEPEKAPRQEGKQRANLRLGGWRFTPEGPNLRVTYIFKISLGGSIPNSIVSMAASETPLCTGRARDAYYDHGHAPFVHAPSPEPSLVFQNEQFDAASRRYSCIFTTGPRTGELFSIRYDRKRMYQDGVVVTIEGGAADAQDDGNGSVAVVTMKPEQNVAVVLVPK
ncbi:hypothetical protein JCM1841_002733 [Sporobolomyces salmonicolor]